MTSLSKRDGINAKRGLKGSQIHTDKTQTSNPTEGAIPRSLSDQPQRISSSVTRSSEIESFNMPSLSDSLLDELLLMPLVGVLRGCPIEHVLAVATTASEAGLRIMEVTLDSPDALDQIGLLSKHLPGTLIGAGTVRSSNQVDSACGAGARFVVSPGTNPSVVKRSLALDVPCVPGAATPSEIEYAFELGAAAVKVFPADQLGGPSYLEALRAPLHGIPLLPSGGIDATNAASYLAAGAIGLAVGARVLSSAALANGDCETVTGSVRKLVESVS